MKYGEFSRRFWNILKESVLFNEILDQVPNASDTDPRLINDQLKIDSREMLDIAVEHP